ncbi:MAG: hypothetical protein FWC01_08825, partial [Treponema sp.]|nr:hypothetical protein [Treponema sp.]MCL2238069.1 hypothetical protein [Treponema sp.]
KNGELDVEDSPPPQSELWDADGKFEEEDVTPEEGMQLPPGVNDPKKVKPEQLRPITGKKEE